LDRYWIGSYPVGLTALDIHTYIHIINVPIYLGAPQKNFTFWDLGSARFFLPVLWDPWELDTKYWSYFNHNFFYCVRVHRSRSQEEIPNRPIIFFLGSILFLIPTYLLGLGRISGGRILSGRILTFAGFPDIRYPAFWEPDIRYPANPPDIRYPAILPDYPAGYLIILNKNSRLKPIPSTFVLWQKWHLNIKIFLKYCCW